MRISLFLEGSYPYVVGGVSQWVQMMISQMPEHEFILNTLIVDRSQSKKFKYELPKNVIEVRETYLNDHEWGRGSKRFKLNDEQYDALRQFVRRGDVNWKALFSIMDTPGASINKLLMGPDMLNIAEEIYNESYAFVTFADFLWTLRSMYLPLFITLQTEPVQADLYHAISTGYAGIMAVKAQMANPAPLVLTEHGIYTREREEEIIRADWTKGVYKDLWINYFNEMSSCIYDRADRVIALYEGAQKLQHELGCPKAKTEIVPNGIYPERFADLPQKDPDDDHINVGGILRVTPIKDVKTMITAFQHAKQRVPNLRLYLLGPTDEDPEYYEECVEMVSALELTEDVIFAGRVDVTEYMGKMDMVILTSISEGQPLTMLEAMTARRPCIATNVGSCKQLLYGFENDDLGRCGIITPVMMADKIADAIVTLAKDPELRAQMGEIGHQRTEKYYQQNDVLNTYKNLYSKLTEGANV